MSPSLPRWGALPWLGWDLAPSQLQGLWKERVNFGKGWGLARWRGEARAPHEGAAAEPVRERGVGQRGEWVGPGREGPWQAQWEMSPVVTLHGSQMHVGEALKFRVFLVGSTNTYQFGYYVEMRNSLASRKYVSTMKAWPPGCLLDTLRCSSEWELPPGVWRRVMEPVTSCHSSPVFDGSPCHLWHTWSGQG